MNGFDRIVVGVDASPESLTAVRWAAALAEPDGALMLVAVAHTALAAQAGFASGTAASQLVADAQQALEVGRRAVGDGEPPTRLLEGEPVACLLAEIERTDADLVAVGSHGQGRVEGILLGGVATAMLHEAPCSVLVARHLPDGPPRTIVVGMDGSSESLHALAVAGRLAGRSGARVRAIAATKGKGLDPEALRLAVPGVELRDGPPVDTLVEESGSADIVVVGSRGLHGLASLGSVSERVAHRAACSVLVVRDPESKPSEGGTP